MNTGMNVTELFLIAMTIIFSVPYLIWRLMKTEFVAPLVVVQIIAGIVLGPGILGAYFPGYFSLVFNHDVVGALNGLAWWSVMIFVLIAGIELDLKQLWEYRRESSITAGLALGVPLLFGSVAAMLMLAWSNDWMGAAGNRWQFVLAIGMSCAVTALPILLLLMEKLHLLREPLGRRILRYASLDDVAIWGVLALILMDWNRVGRQSIFLIGFALASYAFRRLMRKLGSMDRWHVTFIWLALCAYVADWSGLHFMVGAFLAGVVMDADWFDQKELDQLRFFVLMSMMPVFFLSTGLKTHWQTGGVNVLMAAALLLVAAVVGKLAGIRIAGKILHWKKGEASIIGWLLQTKALIMIIFCNVLLDKKIITPDAFTALLIMAIGSTMLTVPMVTKKLQQYLLAEQS